MLKRIITLIIFTLGVGSQGWAEDLSELEHRVAYYIDSALKEGKKHQDCKQRTTAIAAWVESNPLKLKRIAQLTRALRKKTPDLTSDKLKAMREGSGVMGQAFSRLRAQNKDCKLSNIKVIVSLTTAMMTRAERREIAESFKKIKLPKRKPLPKLVAMTPAFPGPMGLFAPLKIGMPLLEAQAAQPALMTSGGMWSGAQPAIGGKFWLRQGCALNRDLRKQKGAFPWEWADTNVNAYVLCTGEAKSESSRAHDQLDTVELGDFHVDLFDSKENHDRILKSLTELWGPSAQATNQDGFSRKQSYHMWRDRRAETCILLSAGHFVKRPEYLLTMRKCWRFSKLLRALLRAPNTPGAIIGATLTSLQKHYGRYSVWIKNDPNKADLKVPMYEISNRGGDTIKLTLDQGRVTRAEVSFTSKGVYTVDVEDHKLLALSESVTNALKGQLKPKTLEAIKAGPTKKNIKGIGVVNAWPDAPKVELKSGISFEVRAHPKMSELTVYLTEAR